MFIRMEHNSCAFFIRHSSAQDECYASIAFALLALALSPWIFHLENENGRSECPFIAFMYALLQSTLNCTHSPYLIFILEISVLTVMGSNRKLLLLLPWVGIAVRTYIAKPILNVSPGRSTAWWLWWAVDSLSSRAHHSKVQRHSFNCFYLSHTAERRAPVLDLTLFQFERKKTRSY